MRLKKKFIAAQQENDFLPMASLPSPYSPQPRKHADGKSHTGIEKRISPLRPSFYDVILGWNTPPLLLQPNATGTRQQIPVELGAYAMSTEEIFTRGVLREVFHQQSAAIQQSIRALRKDGWVIAGTYSYDVAETKMLLVEGEAGRMKSILQAKIWRA